MSDSEARYCWDCEVELGKDEDRICYPCWVYHYDRPEDVEEEQ